MTRQISSTWRPQTLFGLALVGCCIATYLTLYQCGIVTAVWDPIFHDGSRVVLHSSVSRLLPVPDAGLGAVGYLIEAVCVSLGWRNRAWVRVVYAVVVIAFTVVSVGLLIAQGTYFHAWCTLCIASALVSLVIAGVAASEWRQRQ